MIVATLEEIIGEAEAERIEAESMIVSVMSTPPGPLKCTTILPYTDRCKSGPFEGDYE